jgi:hypothetical protein
VAFKHLVIRKVAAMNWKTYTYIELPILAAVIAVDIAKLGKLRDGETVDEAMLAILADLRTNAADGEDTITADWEKR